MDKNYTVGDVVYLNGESPRMKVAYVNVNGSCVCKWTNKNEDIQLIVLQPEALTKERINRKNRISPSLIK